MPPVSLNNFTDAAAHFTAADPDRALRLDGNGVTDASRFSAFFGRNANRATMDGFIAAIREKYGKQTGDFIQDMLKNDHNSGRPLTARMARDMAHMADNRMKSTNELNRVMVDAFIDGGDLDRIVDDITRANEIPQADRDAFKAHIAGELRAKAASGAFHPTRLTGDMLRKGITHIPKNSLLDGRKYFPRIMAARNNINTTAGIADRLRLVDLGLDSIALTRAMWELNGMRRDQPDGELTRETVWKAVLGEKPPMPADLDEGSFGAVLNEKVMDEAIALGMKSGISSMSHPEPTALRIEDALTYIPWSGVKYLLQHPAPINARDTGFDSARLLQHSGAAMHAGDLTRAYNSLTKDLHRTNGHSAFTFVYEDGRSESVHTGLNTDFTFTGFTDEHGLRLSPDEDRQSYLEGRDSSLSLHLTAAVREICGEGASDAQLARVMCCMNQDVLISSNKLTGLARIGDGLLPGNVNVSFSRVEGGAVRATFSTAPEAIKAGSGSFSMILDIGRDGTMELRDLETRPGGADIPLWHAHAVTESMEMSNRAEGSFREAAGRIAAGIPGLPDAAQGGAILGEGILRSLSAGVEGRLRESLAEAAAEMRTLSADEIRQLRDEMLRERLEILPHVRAMAAQLPEGRRDAFTRACLETGLTPQEAHLRPIMELASQAAALPQSLASARDERAVTAIIDDFTQRMATVSGPAEGGGPAIIGRIAVRMGMVESLGTDPARARSIGINLARLHGPFLDTLFTMRRQAASSPAAAGWGQALRETLLPAMLPSLRSVLSEGHAARLNPANISERDLSLAAQRRLQGGAEDPNFFVHGASLDGAPDINATLRGDLPVLCRDTRALAENTLRQPAHTGGGDPPADPNSPQWALSDTFNRDYDRMGVHVNGNFHNPITQGSPADRGLGTGTSEDDFIRLFPDRRSAAQISQLTNQSFNTLLLTPLIERGRNADRPPSGTQGNLLTRWNIMNERGRAEATRTSPEALYLLASSVFTNPNVHDRDTHYSVERLDGTDRYLVSCTASFAAPRNERGGPGPRQTEVTYDPHGNTRPMPVLERLTYEITLEVTLGERPAVNSANLDIMLHGWQDAPPALL